MELDADSPVQSLTLEEFAIMRLSMQAREDFLLKLKRRCMGTIARVTRQFIGQQATLDLIRNEASQAFLLAANRAIDTAKLVDDGRGKNNPEKWCEFKGIGGVMDYLRVEFGTETRAVKKHEFNSRVVYAEDLYRRLENGPFDMSGFGMFADSVDYADSIVSMMNVVEFLKELSPVDKSIIQLLVFGEDDFGRIRNASRWGSPRHRIAADVALTIGRSENFVYTRLSAIREEASRKFKSA